MVIKSRRTLYRPAAKVKRKCNSSNRLSFVRKSYLTLSYKITFLNSHHLSETGLVWLMARGLGPRNREFKSLVSDHFYGNRPTVRAGVLYTSYQGSNPCSHTKLGVWSNGYDVRLSLWKSGFNSPYPRHYFFEKNKIFWYNIYIRYKDISYQGVGVNFSTNSQAKL